MTGQCTRCHGTGFVKIVDGVTPDLKDCDVCGGAGKQRPPCEGCNGIGTIGDIACDSCKGSGYEPEIGDNIYGKFFAELNDDKEMQADIQAETDARTTTTEPCIADTLTPLEKITIYLDYAKDEKSTLISTEFLHEIEALITQQQATIEKLEEDLAARKRMALKHVHLQVERPLCDCENKEDCAALGEANDQKNEDLWCRQDYNNGVFKEPS